MAAAMSQQEWHEGIIKSVVSGDTVVIRGKPIKGPPAERTLCLAFVAAPKLASRPRAGETDARKDEVRLCPSRYASRRVCSRGQSPEDLSLFSGSEPPSQIGI